MSVTGERLQRIEHVTLKNFRGWGTDPQGAARRLKVSGDLVLITGANGHGKSSLLEALVLLLAGHVVNTPSKVGLTDQERLALLTHRTESGEAAEGWELGFSGRSSGAGAPIEGGLRWRPGFDQAEPVEVSDDATDWHTLRERSVRADIPSDLLAIACSFFQDDLRGALDEGLRTKTLRDWFQPLDRPLKALEAWLPERIQGLRQQRDRLDTDRAQLVEPPPTLAKTGDALIVSLTAFADEFGLSLGETPRALRDALSGTDTAPIRGHLADLVALLDRTGGRPLPDKSLDLLKDLERACTDQVESRDDRQRELNDLRAQLTALEAKRGRLNQLEAPLRWAELSHLPEAERPAIALDELLGVLNEFRSHWLQNAPAEDLGVAEPLRLELQRLDPDRLAVLDSDLKATLGDARTARAQRAQVEQEIAQRSKELQRALQSQSKGLSAVRAALGAFRRPLRERLESLTKLAELPSAAAMDQVIETFEAVQLRLSTFLDAVQLAPAAQDPNEPDDNTSVPDPNAPDGPAAPDLNAPDGPAAPDPDGPEQAPSAAETQDPLTDLLCHTLDNTLLRFQPRPGLLPIRLDANGVLRAADGCAWTDLSTGQRAQLALGWMLAHALALRARLPARILLLDDTSTAFDQGNLARQATWLRQLAYHPDEGERWQVFLVSHHDELTSRLVSLLRPPEGRTLRILEFVDWQPTRGPVVRPWDVELRKQDGEAADRLAAAIAELWQPPLITRGVP